MVNDFDELNEKLLDDALAKKQEIDKIFLDVWNTPSGKKMFELLEERFVNRSIANVGDGIDQVFYRQGQADVVKQMRQSVEDALIPRHGKDQ